MSTSEKTTEPKKRSRVTKTQQTVELLRKIYGDKWVPRFVGSPHEGEKIDDAELVLHELAHQALLPIGYRFNLGNMRTGNKVVGDYIETLDRWRQDMHEIYAIAVELNVAQSLGLRLSNYRIIEISRLKNSQLFSLGDYGRMYKRLVQRARRTLKVQRAADTVLALINGVRKEGLEWGTKKRKARSQLFII